MAGFLVAEEGPLSGLIIRLEDGEEWIVGRDPDVAFQVLEDPMVSRKHLIIRLTSEGYIVENLSTINPTSVNGNPLTDPITLQEGDVVQVGSTLFRFTEQDPSIESEDSFKEEESIHPTLLESEDPLDTLSFNEVTQSRWMLKVISGPNTGAEFGIQKSHAYVLGKDPNNCDIIFQDLSVSRQHAKIHVDEKEVVTIEDLKSRNGTYVNGYKIEEVENLNSQDLIAVGTTSFLVIDKEQARETIFSPASVHSHAFEAKEKHDEEVETEEILDGKKSWKDLFIPTKHLVIAGFFGLLVLVGVFGAISLFKTQDVEISYKDNEKQIEETLKPFKGVQYTYNSHTGKIFILGDVLTSVDHQELVYMLKSLPFIRSIEDNVTIDEIVSNDMNALLSRNPNWRAVAMTTSEPGKFVLKGYVQTLKDAAHLSEYVNLNFPYNEKLANEVVIEHNLEAEVQSTLTGSGFVNVSFEFTNGELVLAGRVTDSHKKDFDDVLSQLRKLPGIRSVKNFVIMTSASTASIDISKNYKVTGTSKYGDENEYVVINGMILTKGDSLDGMNITGINSDEVNLEKDGLKYKILYNQQ